MELELEMNWRLLLRMLGADPEHAVRVGITDTSSFCEALLNGRILCVRGVGKRGYRMLCEYAEYPEPVWRGDKMLLTPGQVMDQRIKGR